MGLLCECGSTQLSCVSYVYAYLNFSGLVCPTISNLYCYFIPIYMSAGHFSIQGFTSGFGIFQKCGSIFGIISLFSKLPAITSCGLPVFTFSDSLNGVLIIHCHCSYLPNIITVNNVDLLQ